MTGYKGYVMKANDHDQKAAGFKKVKKDINKALNNMRSGSKTGGKITGSGALSDKEYNRYRN